MPDREAKMKKREMEAITEALRDALTAYGELEAQGTARVAIAQRPGV
jgi:hypothetical protein